MDIAVGVGFEDEISVGDGEDLEVWMGGRTGFEEAVDR